MTPLNVQPAEKLDYREDGSLDVHSVFYTIQGEGPFAGVPAVFIRLAGCTLACPDCDTEYTKGRRRMELDELLKEAATVGQRARLAVITGGEPFRQHAAPLAKRLRSAGFDDVQVETNGTFQPVGWPWGVRGFTVVCSPKTPRIAPVVLEGADHFKYVVRAGQIDPADGLPTASLGMNQPPARPRRGAPVWLQPEDEGDEVKNRDNLKAAALACMKYGHRLTTQLHKGCGLP